MTLSEEDRVAQYKTMGQQEGNNGDRWRMKLTRHQM